MKTNSGGHFIKCDLELHSPRDPQWRANGTPSPTNDKQRREWARNLLEVCEARGLGAIAITDHHDLEYAKIVSEEAASRNITIFPGAELTLDPCQALILFDPGIEWQTCERALVTLGCTPRTPGQPKIDQVVPSQTRIEDAAERINNANLDLDGRFIILPHVGAGHRSIIQSGNNLNLRYKSLRPVGGYAGCTVASCKQNILNGRDLLWGGFTTAVIQTSDARDADFSKVAQNPTWIKFSEPTIEGIRQACLARESRIRYCEPTLPTVSIHALRVGACTFFGQQLSVQINQQCNAIIGGRGSGKSTILEYIRWCLCDQPVKLPDDDTCRGELPEYARKRKSLIEKTLASQPEQSAFVEVDLLIDATRHTVRRNAITQEIHLTIGNGTPTSVSDEQIRELFPIQAYSQKQLSTVSVRVEELRRLIENPIRAKIQGISHRIAEHANYLKDLYRRIDMQRSLKEEITGYATKIESERARIAELQKGLTGLSNEDQKIIAAHAGYAAEDQLVARLEADTRNVRQTLETAQTALVGVPRDSVVPEGCPQTDVVKLMLATVKNSIQSVEQTLQSLMGELDKNSQSFANHKEQWMNGVTQHNTEYEAATQRAQAHKAALEQIATLTQSVSEFEKRRDTLRAELAKVSVSIDEESNGWRTWLSLHKKRAAHLRLECKRLTQQSDGDILATLKRGGDTSKAITMLTETFRGTRTYASNIEMLGKKICEMANPAKAWLEVVMEIRNLAMIAEKDVETVELPTCKQLTTFGFGPNLRRIAANVNVGQWLELMLVSLDDRPEFAYRLGDGEYIPFRNASPGQQATALLTVLLNQRGGPLIIDQPEEDLDNSIISRVTKTIWSAKERRQMILVSHNANLVVNGDAELVIQCDYQSEADRSSGQVAMIGGIDQMEICQMIKNVMEGGEEAFERRKAKYGF